MHSCSHMSIEKACRIAHRQKAQRPCDSALSFICFVVCMRLLHHVCMRLYRVCYMAFVCVSMCLYVHHHLSLYVFVTYICLLGMTPSRWRPQVQYKTCIDTSRPLGPVVAAQVFVFVLLLSSLLLSLSSSSSLVVVVVVSLLSFLCLLSYHYYYYDHIVILLLWLLVLLYVSVACFAAAFSTSGTQSWRRALCR